MLYHAKLPLDFELPLVVMLLVLAAAAAGFTVWGVMKRTVIRRQNKELKRLKEELEMANAVRTRFFANISHELLNPISTIAGMNEMAMREDATDVPKPYFMTMMNYCFDIRDASELLISLINDLMDMSTIEAGKSHLEEQEYDTADMLRSIVKRIKARCVEKGLSFTIETDELIPTRMYGDTRKISQILNNLLSNAVKYTEAGGITLSVSMNERENNVCKISISVKDTGAGIKEEDIEKIFTAYSVTDDQNTDGRHGLGLGLDISRRFAELMGGTLVCKSEYGKGSEFILTIAQKMIDQTPIGDLMEVENRTERGPYVPQFIAPDADILVVDSSSKGIEIIKGLLKETNVFVSAASSIADCLDRIKDTRFNVIFIDQMLLVMNEDEIIAKIRKIDPLLPVYVLTANTASGDITYTSKGFTGYLPKPIDGITLEGTILKHIPPSIAQESSHGLSAETAEATAKSMLLINEINEISVSDGIRNSGGVPSFVSSLKLFRDTIDANAAVIREQYERGDIRLLTLRVHLLVSSATIIGAKKLAKLAEEIEAAGKKNDKDFIDQNIGRLLSDYEAFKEILAGLTD